MNQGTELGNGFKTIENPFINIHCTDIQRYIRDKLVDLIFIFLAGIYFLLHLFVLFIWILNIMIITDIN